VTVPLPPGTRGKDCSVVIEKTRLKVGVKGSEPILDGQLFNEISKDDSSWTIGEDCCRLSRSKLMSDNGTMTIELEKLS